MYKTVGFGLGKPLAVETARAQLERCAEIADETKKVELAVLENPASRIISLTTHDDANANSGTQQRHRGDNNDYPLYHFRRHVVDPDATSHRTLYYPDAIKGETFMSLRSLLDYEGFMLTAIHVGAKPFTTNPNAPGAIETPDISIVGAYDPLLLKEAADFLDSVEMLGGTGKHFMGNIYDIRLENGDTAHFQPFPLSYHGNITVRDRLE